MPREFKLGLANQIRSYLDSEEMHYSFDNENGIFRFGMVLRHGGLLGHVDFRIVVKKDAFQVQVISPLNAPENTREQVAIFLTYVNYRQNAGDFEMDFSDGEIMYKIDQYCADQMPTSDIIERAIYIPCSVYNNYADHLIDVMLGKKTGREAGEESASE